MSVVRITWELARRLAVAVPTVLGASVALFVLLMVGPDPLAALAQEGDVDTSQLAHRYGWDRPWHVQYFSWLGHLVRGDWGDSIRTGEPARAMITDRIAVTASLAAWSTLVALGGAVALGLWTARRRGSRGDRVVTGTMVALCAVPSFLVALALQWAAVQAKDTIGITIVYVGGMPRDGGPIEYAQRFALPVLVLSLLQMSTWMRFQRAELIDALASDAVLAARGRGVPPRLLMRRHALRLALAPLVTLSALELGTFIGGAVVVETVFGLPGLGRLLLDSVQARDVVVALDIVLLSAVAIVVATSIADVVVHHIDPRSAGRS